MSSLYSSTTLLFLLFFLFFFLSANSSQTSTASRRNLVVMDDEEDDQPKPVPKKKNPILSSKNLVLMDDDEDDQPKPVPKKKNPILSSKNQTKPIKPIKPSNSTIKPSKSSNSTKSTMKPTNSTKIKLKSLNTTSNSTKLNLKSSNSTNSTKIKLKPLTFTSNSTKIKSNSTKIKSNSTPKKSDLKPVNPNPKSVYLDDDIDDLITDFRDLPTRIHKSFLPDLQKISITSKAYIFKANKQLTQSVKPFVGKNYASQVALIASCLFLILPLCLVTLLFYQLNSHRSLIFVQAYFAIYFGTLTVTAVVTGLEPLRFFYVTSPESYAWTQAVQTLGYVLYLLAQLIHLVVVFSGGESKGMVTRVVGFGQMVVGMGVGLHYYVVVFHRAVTGESPKANWKVHGIYAACFVVICAMGSLERRKKVYDGGEDGKKN